MILHCKTGLKNGAAPLREAGGVWPLRSPRCLHYPGSGQGSGRATHCEGLAFQPSSTHTPGIINLPLPFLSLHFLPLQT